MTTVKPTTLSRLSRLIPFVSPFFRRLILVFLLSLFGTVLGLLWPLFTKILIDNVLLAKNLRLLFILSGAMVIATALGYGIGALNRSSSAWWSCPCNSTECLKSDRSW